MLRPLKMYMMEEEKKRILERFFNSKSDASTTANSADIQAADGSSSPTGSGSGGSAPAGAGSGSSSGDDGDGGESGKRPPKAPEKKDSEVENESDAEETVVDEDGVEAAKPEGARGTAAGAGGEGGGGDGAPAKAAPPASSEKSLEKIVVPKSYPQLLAIPLTKRPLFPGHYKSLYIKDPSTKEAIRNLVARRQPYIAVFLAKDDNNELDMIKNVDEVHKIGVFAQITNIYEAGMDRENLTVVVYPHRRIRINSVVLPPAKPSATGETAEGEGAKAAEVRLIFYEKFVDLATDAELENKLKESGYQPINYHLGTLDVSLANVENAVDEPFPAGSKIVAATTNEMLTTLRELSATNALLRDQIITFSVQTGGNAFEDPARSADFAAAVSTGDPAELQDVLECLVVEERLNKALVLLKKEVANAKLQQEIAREVDKKITRKQQEYFLMEQLRGIKRELGIESDGKEKLVEKFRERVSKLTLPEAVEKVFNEEITKLQHLEPAASEFNVTRNYLDWITQLPWGKHSKENFHIKRATEVLDEDHYGLKDVKERILEFIAVGYLNNSVEGKIICLVGPPGVGKTSVGKSIARALNREYFRFSVGGLTDVAEIKGHRRTYVGAMPGKVVQALKKVQTENPLIMVDEIDKIGRGHQGDPASALLELLDPEQNSSFLDHYMDVPIDLSKVLFVCTANTTETIPAPLLDRMEVITLSGYVAEEKVAIAETYLAPAARAAAGLENRKVTVTREAIESLIRHYCRESGVRNLKKQIDKIFRKSALWIVKREDELGSAGSEDVGVEKFKEVIEVTPENLKDYVGSPVFISDRMYDTTPAGVVMGLAWTQMGGSALYIESVLESTIKEDSKPSFNRTGQMGDVMKESATIAYTFAKSFMARRFPDNHFFDKAAVHLHVPEGATPKDGPSAGTTMATALVSLATGTPLKADVAMTGELTLTGKVLKIGGVKEKTIAAKRTGVKHIIMPAQNKSDWDELEDYIKEGIEPTFVSWFDEIYEKVF
ncbi:ATP-dependent Lon protease pim1 [Irineochytrium annulatum]|nr:ATP-dependent Lon protease pim1 [Irineochytrium annulatum]